MMAIDVIYILEKSLIMQQVVRMRVKVDATAFYNAVVMRRWIGLRHGNGPIVCDCYNEHLETRYPRLMSQSPF